MRVTLAEGFQRDVSSLSLDARARLFEVILALPAAFRAPQQWSGLGLRKLHASGIWEARVGLEVRLVLAMIEGEAILTKVGSHDQVQRYLRGL